MRNLLGDNLGWRRAGALLAVAGLWVGLLGLPVQAQESASKADQKTKRSRPRKPVNLRDPFRSLLVSPEDMIKQALPHGKTRPGDLATDGGWDCCYTHRPGGRRQYARPQPRLFPARAG